MGVLLENGDDSVPDDQDGQDTRQHSLNNDENDTYHCLGGLCNGELVHKNEDADDRQQTNDLDGNVDNVSGLALKGLVPDEQTKHEGLHYQLRDALGQTVLITDSHNDTLSEHVDDDRNEQPPEVLAVIVVEQLPLDPEVLVFVELARVTIGLLQLSGGAYNFEGEESEHTGEKSQSQTSQQLRSPRVTSRELVHAI